MLGFQPNLLGYISGIVLRLKVFVDLDLFSRYQQLSILFINPPFNSSLSWTNGWNFTKLAWLYQWDRLRSKLSFCGAWPIFKVTGPNSRLQDDFLSISSYLIYPSINFLMDSHQICMGISVGWSQEFDVFDKVDYISKVTWPSINYLWNLLMDFDMVISLVQA